MKPYMSSRIVCIVAAVAVSVVVAVSQPQNPPARETFDVASIRLRPNVDGGRGVSSLTETCPNLRIQIDPRRISITPGVSLHSLITLAYPEWATSRGGGEDWEKNSEVDAAVSNCYKLTAGGILTGGSAWVRSERWDIEAIIPEGPVEYTVAEQSAGPGAARRGLPPVTITRDIGPRVRRMLQNLLADRFKLVLRPQTKEMPVYLLTASKDGFKSNGNNPAFMQNGEPMWLNGQPLGTVKASMRRGVFEGGGITSQLPRNIPEGAAVQNYLSWGFWKMSMPEIATALIDQLERPVLDRTNLTGTFDFHIDYDRDGRSNRPTIFKAIEEVGLKLESSRAPVEVWVIERAEKPSEN
jgi:uncharacterized protein (TIGR03435 family)